MADKWSLDKSGTPRHQHVFAVFNQASDVHAAEEDLGSRGVQSEVFSPDDASKPHEPAREAGLAGTLGRLLKGLGGESHMAERYACYLQGGRLLLAAPVPVPPTAEVVARVMTSHGGYDVTYFRDLAIQSMSPSENIERVIPTHSHTNVDQE